MENECIGCGCSDHNACVVNDVACHWLIVDHVLGIGVCSCCQDSLSEFTKAQERIVDSIENINGTADTLTDEVFDLKSSTALKVIADLADLKGDDEYLGKIIASNCKTKVFIKNSSKMSGDVDCKSVNGNVSSMSGDITHR